MTLFLLIALFAMSITFRQIILSAIDSICKKYKVYKGELKLNQQSLLNKVTRIYLIKVDTKRKNLLRGLVIINNLYIIVLISQIPWSILYLLDINPQDILGEIMTIKHIVLDIPTFIFMLIFTRRKQHVRSFEWKL